VHIHHVCDFSSGPAKSELCVELLKVLERIFSKQNYRIDVVSRLLLPFSGELFCDSFSHFYLKKLFNSKKLKKKVFHDQLLKTD